MVGGRFEPHAVGVLSPQNQIESNADTEVIEVESEAIEVSECPKNDRELRCY